MTTKFYICPCCNKNNSENFIGEDGRINCLYCGMPYFPHKLNGYDAQYQTLKEKQIEALQ